MRAYGVKQTDRARKQTAVDKGPARKAAKKTARQAERVENFRCYVCMTVYPVASRVSGTDMCAVCFGD